MKELIGTAVFTLKKIQTLAKQQNPRIGNYCVVSMLISLLQHFYYSLPLDGICLNYLTVNMKRDKGLKVFIKSFLAILLTILLSSDVYLYLVNLKFHFLYYFN